VPTSAPPPVIEPWAGDGEWNRYSSPPHPPTRLIGREHEVASIAYALRTNQTRLLTLTGPGGVGKTRLAIEVARELDADFAGDVIWVELAQIFGPPEAASELVAGAIARALGTKDPAPQMMAASLAAAIDSRKMALVLDNFEHLLGAAPLIAAVLADCPELVILVTSRECLHLRGERELVVHPLAVPALDEISGDHATGLHGVPAIRLFVERAAEVRDDFALTAANTPAVATLCRQLDGLPLAIELAARWVKVLPPQALAARFGFGLPLLAGGSDLPDRQQTMRNTIGWSYELLRPEEQQLFRRLGVFAGGFTLEAAEAVGGETGTSVILALIAALVDKSLVRPLPVEAPTAVPRFGMLETIREFALERLEASGETEVTSALHAAHIVDLVATLIPKPGGERQGWLERLAPEVPNMRGALARAVESGESEAALRLAEAWQLLSWSSRADSGEALRWLEAALTLDGGTEARVHALIAAAGLAALRGDHARAVVLAEEGLAIALARDYSFGVAYALFYLGVAVEWGGDLDGAAARYTEAIARWRILGEPYWLALSQTNLGIVTFWLGDAAAGGALAAEGLAGSRAVGDAWGTALALGAIGAVACARGELQRAAEVYLESLELWSAMGDQRGVAGTLAGLAGIAVADGDYPFAARLLGAARALAETVQAAHLVHHEQYERVLVATRVTLDAETFAAAWAAGRSLSPEAIAALVAEFALTQD
jgi:predicted ATPase